ncbi:MAG: hypothetical protein FJ388_21730 [Verrucomicrobia bacterium]|nr:hypothetical protein [Verrucomicrobiota bacterium]
MNRYKVLYLANVPHLSSQRIRNIRDFVAAGGGLVASYGTSLCALEGLPPARPMHLFRIGFAPAAPKLVRQDRFELEELIRVRPETPSGAQAAWIERHTSDVSRLDDLCLRPRPGRGPADASWKDKLVPALDYMTVRPLEDAVVAADIVAGENRAVAPGVVLSHFGKGRVAYLAVALESLYLQTNLRAAAEIINSLVLWAAPEPAPYTVEAPDCLIANLTTNGDMRVLHLANWTGNKLEQPDLSEYYLAPIENVRVTLRTPPRRKIRELALLVDAPFRRKDLGQMVEMTLPKLEAYQAIRFRCA